MKQDILTNAFNEISDEYIMEALQPKKRRSWRWVSGVAAVLAVAIAAAAIFRPESKDPVRLEGGETTPAITTAKEPPIFTTPGPAQPLSAFAPRTGLPGQVCAPVLPSLVLFPQSENGSGYDPDAYNAWRESLRLQYSQPEGYADSLENYFLESIPLLLAEKPEENQVCSPGNIYMALAMLAECADGQSRQEILALLGADSIESLRTQASHFWNAHYRNDGATTCLLSNSLWLDEAYTYNPSTADLLAKDYYASVFCGDLGSDEMNHSLQTWLDENTGGLLKEQASQVELNDLTAMALSSAIYYQAKWTANFSAANTIKDTFHTPTGDITCDFMRTCLTYGPYYYGEDYSAVPLGLEGGDRMWLILPDEGQTPQSILASGHALTDILSGREDNAANIRVNLSLPKFDVNANQELSGSMKKLGVSHVFTHGDFSPILPGANIWLDRVDHAARVKIDEEGVEAAAYTVMVFAGAAMPPSDQVDFILDRPFVFLITSEDNIPLFAGVVNNP